jgi:hypothetical protein
MKKTVRGHYLIDMPTSAEKPLGKRKFAVSFRKIDSRLEMFNIGSLAVVPLEQGEYE